MTELPRRYDVTITVDRDGGDHLNPAEFAVAAEQAASARAASIVSAHTASQIISMVTVLPYMALRGLGVASFFEPIFLVRSFPVTMIESQDWRL